MKVTTEQKEECIIDFHIELPPERFHATWKEVCLKYCRLAKIPGFRKGKIPLSLVEKRYFQEIKQEVTDHLSNLSLRELLNEKKIHPIQTPTIHSIKVENDFSLCFTASVVKISDLNLPKYKGIEIAIEKPVTDEGNVDQILENMREEFAEFKTIEGREILMEDFAVLDYMGTIDGVSLAKIYPDIHSSCSGRKNCWIKLTNDRPVPGLAASIVGMKSGESRECEVTFPITFTEAKLRGYKVIYKVTLHEIKERMLPLLDDAFANKLMKGSTLKIIREKIYKQLKHNDEENFLRNIRSEIIQKLLSMVAIELPSIMIQQETTAILGEIIQANRSRGVSEDEIRSHQEELLSVACKNATEKVKLNFILEKIVQEEKIRVSREELAWYITSMAEKQNITPKKLLKELQKNHRIPDLEKEIALSKALDVAVSHAKVNGDHQKSIVHSNNFNDKDQEIHIHSSECSHEH